LPTDNVVTKKVKRKKIRTAPAPESSTIQSKAQAQPSPAAAADVDFLSKKEWKTSVKVAQDKLKDEQASAVKKKQDKLKEEQAATAKNKHVEAIAKTPPAAAPVQAEVKSCFSDLRNQRAKTAEPEMDTNGVKRKAVVQVESVPDNAKKVKGQDGAATVKVLGGKAYRKEHDIVVTGTCPEPVEDFTQVSTEFGEPLVSALHLQGYTAPTPIQAQAWPIALRGQDMVAVAKTGSGKTLGFLLPAMARLRQSKPVPAPERGEPTQPRVLVLAPTRELVQQIAGEAEKFAAVSNLRVVAIYGGVAKGDQSRDLQRGADVLIATTGRILDFMTGSVERGHKPLVSVTKVSYLVLDEADRMLDMGFEPDIRKIAALCPKSGRPEDNVLSVMDGSVRQTLFFTATWPRSVQRTASSFTAPGAVQIRIGQGAGGDELTANKSVTQTVQLIDEKQKLTRLLEILEAELKQGESAFVFAKTKKTCDYLEQKLYDAREELSIGTWCRAIHSHREQWERDQSLATFRQITTGKDNGRRGILCATDVAARGLDIPGVALVVVYDFGGGNLGDDSGVESYVHRIGRTGRAGLEGKAFTFFTEHDTGARKFVKILDEAKQRVPYELRALAEKSRGGGGG